jgi:hypothetical protein
MADGPLMKWKNGTGKERRQGRHTGIQEHLTHNTYLIIISLPTYVPTYDKSLNYADEKVHDGRTCWLQVPGMSDMSDMRHATCWNPQMSSSWIYELPVGKPSGTVLYFQGLQRGRPSIYSLRYRNVETYVVSRAPPVPRYDCTSNTKYLQITHSTYTYYYNISHWYMLNLYEWVSWIVKPVYHEIPIWKHM